MKWDGMRWVDDGSKGKGRDELSEGKDSLVWFLIHCLLTSCYISKPPGRKS